MLRHLLGAVDRDAVPCALGARHGEAVRVERGGLPAGVVGPAVAAGRVVEGDQGLALGGHDKRGVVVLVGEIGRDIGIGLGGRIEGVVGVGRGDGEGGAVVDGRGVGA